MIRGTIKTPEVGTKYKLHLGSGQTIEVIFEGFGNYMSTKWKNTLTNEEMVNLPPYEGYEKV
jgi:hypothetical protein